MAPPKKTAATTAKAPRKTSTRARKKANVIETVKDLKPQDVAEVIGQLQINLQSTLAGLSAAMIEEVEKMHKVGEAIEEKEKNLTDLYEIEKEAMSIEDMRTQKETEEKDWAEEKRNRLAAWAEDETEREKKWKREDEEHTYAQTQRLRRSQEDYNSEISRNRRKEGDRQADLEKTWGEREEELEKQETELAELREEVAGFDEKLKGEVIKAEAILTNKMKRQYGHETALLNKDSSAESNLHTMKVSALDDTINGLEGQIEDLQTQLTSARTDAKDVTSAALQSASDRTALDAVQKVVATQTKSK